MSRKNSAVPFPSTSAEAKAAHARWHSGSGHVPCAPSPQATVRLMGGGVGGVMKLGHGAGGLKNRAPVGATMAMSSFPSPSKSATADEPPQGNPMSGGVPPTDGEIGGDSDGDSLGVSEGVGPRWEAPAGTGCHDRQHWTPFTPVSRRFAPSGATS